MATQNLSARIVLEHANDTGDSPVDCRDTNTRATPLVLSGYTDLTIKRLALATDADDQEVTFDEAILLYIESTDYPFHLRLANGETLVPNLSVFGPLVAADEDEGLPGPILLTGTSAGVANLIIWIVEKPE